MGEKYKNSVDDNVIIQHLLKIECVALPIVPIVIQIGLQKRLIIRAVEGLLDTMPVILLSV